MTGPAHDIAPTMWAIRLHAAGGPGELVLERIETPHPAVGEALVRVHAAAITPDELDWPTDRLPATPSYEFSGEVAAIAPDVDTLAVGDDVWALSDFGRDGAAPSTSRSRPRSLPRSRGRWVTKRVRPCPSPRSVPGKGCSITAD